MAVDRDVEVGGNRLTITEAGIGGAPLLLLHGFAGARTDFEVWVDPLAALGYHVVAPDQRGHGASDKPKGEAHYSLALFASDALALADQLGWDRFSLFGHSMGGMVAQQIVIDSPSRIAALVLMDTTGGAVSIDAELRDLGAELARTVGTSAIADYLRDAESPLTTDAYRRACIADPAYETRGDRNLRAASGSMYAAMLLAIDIRVDQEPALADAVRCPALVMVGAEDEPFLAPSRKLAGSIAGAEFAVIDGGGHSPQFEAPEAAWSVLSTFLSAHRPQAVETPKQFSGRS